MKRGSYEYKIVSYHLSHMIGVLLRPSHGDPDRIEKPGSAVVNICTECRQQFAALLDKEGKLIRKDTERLVLHVLMHYHEED